MPFVASLAAFRAPVPSERLEAGVVALLFAVGVLLTPWEALAGFTFYDFHVYVENFQPDQESLREMHDLRSPLEFFTYEILWDEFVRLLVRIAGDPYLVMKAISGFVLWVNAYLLYRRYGYLLPTLMMLNPLFLDFALSQLRLAFAISLLLIALSMRSRVLPLCLVAAALFIHTSTPLFIGLFLVAKYVERHGQEWQLHRILAIAGVVCAALIFLLAFGREALLLVMEDRRASVYSDPDSSSSLMYVSFWFGLLAMQCLAGREYLRRPDNLYAAMILFLFVGLTMLGTYGSRFAAAAYPVVVAATLNLPAENRNVVLPTFLAFQIIQLLYWFGIIY
jgi:hypothetical protein